MEVDMDRADAMAGGLRNTLRNLSMLTHAGSGYVI